MPLSRGRGGGSVVANERLRKPKGKKLCELGTSCPYQHEYQHQLEFTHEVSTSSTSTEAVRGRGERRRGGVSTGRSLNGTGARGRTVAVAADRIRAERSLRQGVGQDLLGVHGGDAREAQRARWILRMQEQMEEKGAAEVRGSDPSPSSNRVPSLLSDGVQLVPPPAVSSAPIPSRHSSLSSSLGLRNLAGSSEAEAAPLETGQRRNDVVGRKRASPGSSNEDGVNGKDREVICLDCDTDDD